MPSLTEIKHIGTDYTNVVEGTTAILNCTSNDDSHNFLFWQLKENQFVGPEYDYDESKYKFQVLSGRLLIKDVLPEETGAYSCFSKSVDSNGLRIGMVELVTSEESNPVLDAFKLVAIILSFLVIIGCAVMYYRLRQDWERYDGRSIIPDDDEIDDDGDIVYNKTTTSINQPTPAPSRDASSDDIIFGIDNQGLDTDFNSVFAQIQTPAAPLQSLI